MIYKINMINAPASEVLAGAFELVRGLGLADDGLVDDGVGK